MSKLAAFFMAVYLFFAGLFYGNAPVQVEILESPFDSGPVTVQVPHHAGGVFEENGQTVTYWNVSGNWAFRCKNTGRPIKGESHYQPTVTLIPAQPDQPELRLISVSGTFSLFRIILRMATAPTADMANQRKFQAGLPVRLQRI